MLSLSLESAFAWEAGCVLASSEVLAALSPSMPYTASALIERSPPDSCAH